MLVKIFDGMPSHMTIAYKVSFASNLHATCLTQYPIEDYYGFQTGIKYTFQAKAKAVLLQLQRLLESQGCSARKFRKRS